jgi:hypothetical protein
LGAVRFKFEFFLAWSHFWFDVDDDWFEKKWNSSIDHVCFVCWNWNRYHPKFLQSDVLAPDVRAELDSLNSTLAKKLQTLDPLFSERLTTNGFVCLCLGVVSETYHSFINYSSIRNPIHISFKMLEFRKPNHWTRIWSNNTSNWLNKP